MCVPVYLSTLPWRSTCMRSKSITSPFCNLGIRFRWMAIFTSRLRCPRERTFDTHYMGGWLGPAGGLATLRRRQKVICLWRKLIPDSLAIQPIHFTLHKRRCKKQRLWITYVIVCEYSGNQTGNREGIICPGSVWNREGSEIEEGEGPYGIWLSSRIMRVQSTELEVCCM